MKNTSRDDDNERVDHSQFREFVLADAVGASKALLNEVKERFQNQPHILNMFRNHLSNFTKRRIDVESLGLEVNKLFKGHDDLIHMYNAFLPNAYKINPVDNRLERAIELVNKVKIRFEHEEQVYEKFLAILIREERFWLKKEVAELLGNHEDLFEEFERYMSDEKLMLGSIQHLDLSKCKQVSPSYWILPENCQTPLASHRSEVDDKVLNDNLVCCASTGTESYSFIKRQRTRQEEILLKCEDDRFELDMLLERVKSAAERTEELMIEIDDQNQDDEERSAIEIKGYFSDMDLSCIERLYGDHGLDVIDYLHTTPTIALPLILKRLKQKQDDLIKCHSDFNKVWVHVCSKNHYKLQKMQLRELKDSRREDSVADHQFKEKMQGEEDVGLDVSRNKQPILPNSDVHPLC